jgi:hypothetical protein
MTKGDIYVADGYGKVKDGTLIGSSLGNASMAKPAKASFSMAPCATCRNCAIPKDLCWVKGHHPSYIKDMTPTSINAPIRIGEVTVLPGDVVFANEYGVAFIRRILRKACKGF